MTDSASTVTGRRWHSNQPSFGRQVHQESAILQAYKGDSEHQIPCTVKIYIEIDRRQRAASIGARPIATTLALLQLCSAPAFDRRKAGSSEDQVLLDSLLVVLLPQRCRSLLFLDGFSDESDDLLLFRYVVELCDGEREV